MFKMLLFVVNYLRRLCERVMGGGGCTIDRSTQTSLRDVFSILALNRFAIDNAALAG